MKKTYFLLAVLLITLKVFTQYVTFTTHIVDENFDGPAGIFISNLNNDGNKDVISAAVDANTIAWWENQTGDSITWQKYLVDNDFTGAIYVSAADIDSDSLTDIMGAAYDGNEIAWWHNEGGNPIQWTKQIIESNFDDAHEIMASDVDQDNDMDILGVSAGLNTIAWFENDGNYPVQWTKHIVDSNFSGARSVDAGDLDGDGDIDLAGAALTSNEVAWWRNDGGIPIVWTKFIINSNFIYSHKVHIVDIDLDNDPDILGTAYSSGISWWRNDGGDTIAWEKQLISGLNSAVIAYALDINQDNDYDVISSYQGSGRVILWNNEGNNTLDWGFQFVDDNLAGAWPLHYGDLDNDGDIDIVCGGRDENEIRWYEVDILTNIHVNIKSSNEKNEIDLIPNPAKEAIEIHFTGKVHFPLNITFCDISGKLLKTTLITSNNDKIDISTLPVGVYFVSTIINREILTKKFVKK